MPLLTMSRASAPAQNGKASPAKAARPILRIAAPVLPTVDLPLEPSAASDNINDYSFLWHGEKKIGKTTAVCEEEGVLLLTFDPLQKALSIMQRHVPDWDHFEAYLQKLEESAAAGKYPYKRSVVDGVDIWYMRCQDKICRDLAIKHPSEEEWGKGWDRLKTTFARGVDRIMALPGGCWFISHSRWAEIKTRTGGKINKLIPNIRASGEEILVGKVDGWIAYDYSGSERIMIVKGDEMTGAGHRIRGHFLTPKGRQVAEIPAGEDEHEAWQNFLNAFNNKQTFTTIAERNQQLKKKPAPKG